MEFILGPFHQCTPYYKWMIWDFGHVECANNILCGCSLFWQKFHLPLLSFSLSMLYSALPPYSFIDLLSFTYLFNLYSITLSFTFSFTWTSWIILGQNILPLKMASSSHYFSVSSYCCCNRILHWHSQFIWPRKWSIMFDIIRYFCMSLTL